MIFLLIDNIYGPLMMEILLTSTKCLSRITRDEVYTNVTKLVLREMLCWTEEGD